MQLLLAGALAILISLAMLGQSAALLSDQPVDAQIAVASVDQYRMFMYSAAQYMSQASLPAVTSTTPVPWSAIAASSLTPPGAAHTTMPANWHIVRNVDGTWQACTDMDERSIEAIEQLVPRASGVTPVYQSGAVSSIVLGTTDSSAAQSMAALCNL